MNTLALDPGKVTGWAIATDNILDQTGEYEWGVFCGQLLDSLWVSTENELRFCDVKIDEVVCERFLITERTLKVARQMEPLYTIGVVVAVCKWFGVPLVFQTATEAKQLVPDSRLRLMGWYVPKGHARDAVRHLVRRLVVTRELAPSNLRGEW